MDTFNTHMRKDRIPNEDSLGWVETRHLTYVKESHNEVETVDICRGEKVRSGKLRFRKVYSKDLTVLKVGKFDTRKRKPLVLL